MICVALSHDDILLTRVVSSVILERGNISKSGSNRTAALTSPPQSDMFENKMAAFPCLLPTVEIKNKCNFTGKLQAH